jgi:hypothetical protein
MVTIEGTSQWTQGQIAALSDLQLARLNYDEMVGIVLVSGVPVRDIKRVCSLDGDTLVRLVHCARRFCRDQTKEPSRGRLASV